MRTDDHALRSFAHLGLKLFWLRQVMFIGATAITTAYLSSYVPVLCYLVCLGTELAEVSLARRILSQDVLTRQKVKLYAAAETLVGGASALAVCTYGAIVARLGDAQFLFVPLIYMFAAALYGTMFNHQIKHVLVVRMAIYVAGFLYLTGYEVISAGTDQRFLAFVQFFTVVSASFFIAMNAVEFRRNYCDTRTRELEAIEREAKLRSEMKERQSAELARLDSDTRFRSLFENAPIPIREEDLSGMKRLIDGLAINSPDELSAYLDKHPEFLDSCASEIVVVDANRASLDQHGYSDKSEMLAKVVRALSPAARQIVRMTIETIHQGGKGKSYETEITRADGKVRTVAATWSVIPGHEKTYARILLCSVDLTERLASEAAFRQAQKMEAVGQLTGGVAHDFNNLLTVISGNVELLEESIDVDPELSDPIKRAVHRGAELTQRLLAFSRKQPLVAQAIDLRTQVTEMTDLLRRSLGEEIAVETDFPNSLWLVYADPGQVEAALLNLALNARDAMPDGGTLSISCRNAPVVYGAELDVDIGDYVVLSVSDTGSGIEPQDINRVFDPFFTTKEVGKGSGLGLSMVYGFAKQSGGTAQVQSSVGKGTTVSLFLPRTERSQASTKTIRSHKGQPSGRGETILLLEDDDGVRRFLTNLISSFGYRPLPARDVEAARELISGGEEIDLLVSDIMLPGGIRGPEFAEELLDRCPGTPILFISGRPSEIEKALSQGVRETTVLSKPFSKDQILKEIDQALGHR